MQWNKLHCSQNYIYNQNHDHTIERQKKYGGCFNR